MTETFLVPDGFTPIVGWRAWRASRDESAFGSFFTTIRYSLSFDLYGSGSGDKPKKELKPAPKKVVLISTTRDDEWPYRTAMQATCGKTHLASKHTEYDARKGEHFLKPVKGVRLWSPREYCPPTIPAPVESCTCGIYASRDRDGARDYGSVLGRVAMWGKVIEAERGWRSQFAYPQALYVEDEKHAELVARFAEYGIPVLKKSVLESA